MYLSAGNATDVSILFEYIDNACPMYVSVGMVIDNNAGLRIICMYNSTNEIEGILIDVRTLLLEKTKNPAMYCSVGSDIDIIAGFDATLTELPI